MENVAAKRLHTQKPEIFPFRDFYAVSFDVYAWFVNLKIYTRNSPVNIHEVPSPGIWGPLAGIIIIYIFTADFRFFPNSQPSRATENVSIYILCICRAGEMTFFRHIKILQLSPKRIRTRDTIKIPTSTFLSFRYNVFSCVLFIFLWAWNWHVFSLCLYGSIKQRTIPSEWRVCMQKGFE